CGLTLAAPRRARWRRRQRQAWRFGDGFCRRLPTVRGPSGGSVRRTLAPHRRVLGIEPCLAGAPSRLVAEFRNDTRRRRGTARLLPQGRLVCVVIEAQPQSARRLG